MRCLVDECSGPRLAGWLRARGHEVFSVYEQARGMADAEILEKARSEGWILVTTDKDFGEMVYRERQHHQGVVFLRLQDERSVMKIAALEKLLAGYSDRLEGSFVVVSDTQARFGRA